MSKRQVFYSFHYRKDAMRAAQVRNIGLIEGNKIASDNEWEEVARKGDDAIREWIDKNMQYRSCLIVLIGEETHSRKWVKYEIKHAWQKGMGVFGIHVHNLKDPRYGKSNKGMNPFSQFKLGGVPFDSVVKCYDPSSIDTYKYIEENIGNWIEEAIRIRTNF